MKKLILHSLSFAAALIVCTSCQEEDFGYDAKTVSYLTAFKKDFTNIDSNQTWMTVRQVSLNLDVNIEGSFTLYVTSQKICDENSDNVLYGKFENIEGDGNSYSFKFDYPSGADNVYVSLVTENGTCWMQNPSIEDNQVASTFGDATESNTRASFAGFGTMGNCFFAYSNTNQSKPVSRTYLMELSGYTISKLEHSEYIIAFEDLGGVFDWDFNDAVILVKHQPLHEEMEVTLLAAGGTLPIELAFDGEVLKDSEGRSELHQMFGQAASDLYTPVNVGRSESRTDNESGSRSVVFASSAEFAKDDFTISSIMSRFSLLVSSPTSGETWSVDAAKQDKSSKVPQAIMIADRNWAWPQEEQSIAIRYPDFTTWVADANLGNKWYSSIWTGNDATSADSEEDFAEMLSAKATEIFQRLNRKGLRVISDDKDKDLKIDEITFHPYLTEDQLKDKVLDFTARTDDAADNPWQYENAFKSKRLLLDINDLKETGYTYFYKGYTDVSDDGTKWQSYRSDSVAFLAFVIKDRPYNEGNSLWLSTCKAGNYQTVDDIWTADQRIAAGWWEEYDEGLSCVDLCFNIVYLKQLTYDDGHDKTNGDAFLMSDWTVFGSKKNPVLPFDLVAGHTEFVTPNIGSTTQAPTSSIYGVFIGEPKHSYYE